MQEAPATVFYDGRCGMCRGYVVRARKLMRPDSMLFLENTSREAEGVLVPLGLKEAAESTLIVLANEAPLLRAEAALEMGRRLRWPWRAVTVAGILPLKWLNAMYDWRAARRVRDDCVMALPE